MDVLATFRTYVHHFLHDMLGSTPHMRATVSLYHRLQELRLFRVSGYDIVQITLG